MPAVRSLSQIKLITGGEEFENGGRAEFFGGRPLEFVPKRTRASHSKFHANHAVAKIYQEGAVPLFLVEA